MISRWRKQNVYNGLKYKRNIPDEILLKITHFGMDEPVDYLKEIKSSDTYCLDKRRFCFSNREQQYQCSFCGKCGDYVIAHSINQDYFEYESMECKCEVPDEDWHGNVMMELMLIVELLGKK